MTVTDRRTARRGRQGIGFAATLGLMLLLPGLAQAQAYQRIAPHFPASQIPPSLPLPAAGPAGSASKAPILAALRGLVFLPARSALRPGGLPAGTVGTRDIDTAGLPLLSTPAFHRALAPYLGHPLSFAGLEAIEGLTRRWYARHGRPFVDVTVPPQNIASGIVQVLVMEYRVGKVKVSGNRWFSSALLTRESHLAPGDTLTLEDMRADLAVLNANPFRSVNAVLHPGAQTGLTDVDLQIHDQIPARVYATYDNQGVVSLGRGEWGVGGIWGNVAGLDGVLSYQFTRTVSGRYAAHALSWTAPLPWGDKLLVFGSYATERPDAGPFFEESGHSGQASLRYVHVLPYLQLGGATGLSENVQIGYDFKTSNNDLEFGGEQVFAGTSQIDQFPVIYEATETDPLGQTAASNHLVFSPGGLSGKNTAAAFSLIEPGAHASYIYDTLSLTRTTKLPADFSWTARVLGQVASHNLLYSEQLGVGGLGSVRGYFTDSALGSEGVLVSQELRAPPFSVTRLAGLRGRVADIEQLGVFWDYGHVTQVTPIPDQGSQADLASLGLDLHSRLGAFVNATVDLGWQLRPAPGAREHGAFADLAVVVGL